MVTSRPFPEPASSEFDWQQLNQLAGEDAAFETELLEMFLKEALSSLKELEQAIATRSVQTVENIAHSLRGASANVGAIALAAASRQLEMRARDGQFDGQFTEATALVQKMDSHCESIRSHLRSRL